MAKARTVDLEPGLSFGEAARRTVAVRAAELIDHRHAALADDDIEGLHDLRVAGRRLRAAMEVFGEALPARHHKRLLNQVKAIGDATGAPRDLDVHLEALERYRAAVPVADRAGIDDLMRHLRSERHEAGAAIARAVEPLEDGRLGRGMARLVGRPLDHLPDEPGPPLPPPPPEPTVPEA